MDAPPPDELAERGRAIFDRLRGGDETPQPAAEWLPEEAPPSTAVAVEDELPEDLDADRHFVDEDEVVRELDEVVDEVSTATDAEPEPSADVEPAVDEPEPTADEAEPSADAESTAGEPEPTADEAEPAPDAEPTADADVAAEEPSRTPEDADATPGWVAEAAQAAVAAEAGPADVRDASEPSTVGSPDGGEKSEAGVPAARSAQTPAAEPAVRAATPPNPFLRPLPRVLAIANQKGGVGKTTTAVNLGAALAELGYKVLVVDLDPQGNATTGLGINARNLQASIYDVIMNEVSLEDCIEPTTLRNLYVAPATIDLAGAEIELVPAFSRELKLRRALDELEGEYDYTLIDCPPSLGLLTVNGLAAATEVVVPIQCEYYALEGLSQLMKNVGLVKTNLNPRLEVSAFILTMYDARTKLADQVAQEVRNHFGGRVCRNIVPRTVRLSEAPSFGQPVIVFDPSSRGAIAYRELAREVSGGTPQRVG